MSQYVLVQMMDSQYDALPALLVKQDTVSGISAVMVFQYYLNSGEVQAAGVLPVGIEPRLGTQFSLYVPTDRYSLIHDQYFAQMDSRTTYGRTLSNGGPGASLLWDSVRNNNISPEGMLMYSKKQHTSLFSKFVKSGNIAISNF